MSELLDGLGQFQATVDGRYTYQDETRDFRAVFSTEVGRRVLSIIAQICDPKPVGLHNINYTTLLAVNEGRRSVMHEIMLRYAGRGAAPMKGETNE